MMLDLGFLKRDDYNIIKNMKALFLDMCRIKPLIRLSFTFVTTTIIALFGVCGNINAQENNFPFAAGEKLTYALKWTFIPAGEAVLEVLPVETINGIKARHFLLTVHSNLFIDHFYMVRDRVDAYTDMGMNHSVLYKKKQLEGTTRRDIVVKFNWDKKEASYTNFEEKRDPIKIFAGTFDPLSAFYYTRCCDLNAGLTIERPVTDGKKNVIGKAIIVRRETIKLKIGTFDTYLMEPEVEQIGGVFEKSKDAKIQLWVTADQRQMPVKIRSKVIVGSFVGELVSATGLK